MLVNLQKKKKELLRAVCTYTCRPRGVLRVPPYLEDVCLDSLAFGRWGVRRSDAPHKCIGDCEGNWDLGQRHCETTSLAQNLRYKIPFILLASSRIQTIAIRTFSVSA